MVIGVPKETKTDEYRVGVLPAGVRVLAEDGHRLLVQKGAGVESGFDDEGYRDAGAELVNSAQAIYDRASMIVKVKEPMPGEISMLRKDQIVFTYFHFAASKRLIRDCLRAGISAVAYETLFDEQGRLPLLTPMSEVAGKMSIQAGARCLEKQMGGSGVLFSGAAGVSPANVLVLGAGVVGASAARVAGGMGANVWALDTSLDRIRHLEEVMPANVKMIYSDPHAIEFYLRCADLVVGAVLIPGAQAPKLIKRRHLKQMKKGSVIVDVAIDQGGCCETSRPTTHRNPTYAIDGVVHYCVANMPGAVSQTSSRALCNATLPYARLLASLGLDGFISTSKGHAAALNMRNGQILNHAVAEAYAGQR